MFVMSRLLIEQRPFLELYLKASLLQRRALLQTVSVSQLRALSEIVHNVLVGNVSLTPAESEKLKKKRSLLYVLGDKRVRHSRKKRVLQTGANIIQYVLRIALPHMPWRPSPS